MSTNRWGYLQTGSGVPRHQLPLISRLISLPFLSLPCRLAFNRTTPPDIARINRHGGVGISYPRLANIDGERDPWRYASPHRIGLPERPNTDVEPFMLIQGGVHHWDENGVWKNETVPGSVPPGPVEHAQEEEVRFVRGWVKEWKKGRKCTGGRPKKGKKGGK